jgi:hypothetical protein
MIQFDKPASLNGADLLEELNAGGVTITEPPMIDGNGKFWLDIDEKDIEKAKTIVAAHIGIDREPTITDKLASVGLSVTDLKAALGL